MDVMPTIDRIMALRREIVSDRAVLVALSGIDGSGKGYVAAQLAAAMSDRGIRVASINVDGWLNLPGVRFSLVEPAAHFYRNAIRFDALFQDFVLPLRDRRSIRATVDHADETAAAYRRRVYDLQDIDVILLEGIQLLRRSLRAHYDLAIWIDCTFETALERAVARGQEGLSAAATIEAYRSIYFPAQEIHFRQDDPAASADLVIANDARLFAATSRTHG